MPTVSFTEGRRKAHDTVGTGTSRSLPAGDRQGFLFGLMPETPETGMEADGIPPAKEGQS